MGKKINCDECGALVAELAKGTKWRTGSIAICPKCVEAKAKEKFAEALKNVGKSDNPFGGMTDDLFGDKMGGFMNGLFGDKK